MDELKYKVAKREEAEEIRDFEAKCFAHPSDRFKLASLRYLATSPTCRTIVARGKDKSICGVVIGILRRFHIPSGRVYKIGVLPKYVRKGVGTKLLLMIERWFVKSGMVKACAEVRESNFASRKLFEKNRYKFTKKLVAYYLHENGGAENGLKYWKTFKRS